LEAVLAEFQELKKGEGLTPAKMAKMQATLAVMRSQTPDLAVQQLLDDMVDIGGDDVEALKWALRAHPRSHEAMTLGRRREISGVPHHTAMDRERRAVEALFERWAQTREFWMNAVYGTMAKFLPVIGKVQFGPYEVEVEIFDDEDSGLPVIEIESSAAGIKTEALTIVRERAFTHVVFTTSKYPWALHLNVRRFDEPHILVRRRRGPEEPRYLLVETADPTGRSRRRQFDSSTQFDGAVIELAGSDLDFHGTTVSWWWTDVEPVEAAITFKESERE
jgi:hypothetical protein